MEMVEELLLSGEKTGRVVSRNEAHSKGLWHRTVHVWVHNRLGDLLLQKRASTKESHPDLWDISCAGHISAGDGSDAAAVREMREELGISIDANELHHLFSLPQQCVCGNNSFIDNEITDVYLCMIPIEPENITIAVEEVADIRFYPVNSLKKELVENSSVFVPHDEEYHRLFEFLEKQSVREIGGEHV